MQTRSCSLKLPWRVARFLPTMQVGLDVGWSHRPAYGRPAGHSVLAAICEHKLLILLRRHQVATVERATKAAHQKYVREIRPKLDREIETDREMVVISKRDALA